MGMALYRKYRSKSLGEIVGQEHITATLENALKNGKISHAYLFTGPKGVGKTSIARILAHAVNDLPYEGQSTHLDIIEIDAASNRRIDEIRELRERISNAPTSARYKVYIIDEVHMLTREAFNALLKTLEEPPEHVIFILATTEAHKLPDTIISRTQRFTFKPIDVKKAAAHLAQIAKAEKIEATQPALELIARHGDGSFRDSISLLEQAAALGEEVTVERVHQILGEVPDTALDQLLSAIGAGNTIRVIETLAGFKDQGFQSATVAKQLAARLRSSLIKREGLGPEQATNLLAKLVEIPASYDPEGLLEIYLLEVCLKNSGNDPKEEAPQPIEDVQPVKEAEVEAEPAKQTNPVTKPKPSGKFNEQSWQAVLDALKSRHNTLYSLARMGTPNISQDQLTLEFSFPFHQKRLNESRNKQIIMGVIKETSGQDIDVVAVVGNSAPKTSPEAAPPPDKTLENISNIFGGAEVLD